MLQFSSLAGTLRPIHASGPNQPILNPRFMDANAIRVSQQPCLIRHRCCRRRAVFLPLAKPHLHMNEQESFLVMCSIRPSPTGMKQTLQWGLPEFVMSQPDESIRDRVLSVVEDACQGFLDVATLRRIASDRICTTTPDVGVGIRVGKHGGNCSGLTASALHYSLRTSQVLPSWLPCIS
jgi:hypothetical protein